MKSDLLSERLAIAATDRQSDGQWAPFGEQVKAGDELWTFASPSWTWQSLCGRGGLALVRNGEIIATHVIWMS